MCLSQWRHQTVPKKTHNYGIPQQPADLNWKHELRPGPQISTNIVITLLWELDQIHMHSIYQIFYGEFHIKAYDAIIPTDL